MRIDSCWQSCICAALSNCRTLKAEQLSYSSLVLFRYCVMCTLMLDLGWFMDILYTYRPYGARTKCSSTVHPTAKLLIGRYATRHLWNQPVTVTVTASAAFAVRLLLQHCWFKGTCKLLLHSFIQIILAVWRRGGALVSIKVVSLRRTQLVPDGWPFQVFNQPPILTQPGHSSTVVKWASLTAGEYTGTYTTQCSIATCPWSR